MTELPLASAQCHGASSTVTWMCPRPGGHGERGRTIEIARDGDRRRRNYRSLGKLLFQALVSRFTSCEAQPPAVIVDHDTDVIRVIERRRGAAESGIIKSPLRRRCDHLPVPSWQFSGDTVIDIMRTHPLVIIGGILLAGVSRQGFYRFAFTVTQATFLIET